MLEFHVKDNIDVASMDAACTQAEHIVAIQALKDTSPFVPMLSGSFNQRSRVEGNKIVYPGPYARYLYYGKKMVNARTGKGPAFIPGIGYRFPKGSTLIPTETDLNFTKDFHPRAQARWFEASKAMNLLIWLDVAKKAIAKYGK